ncbi:MAG: homoserine dehydrogenase [Desulfatibacillaceae bacterium]|nr:homoserine dehydrogenase [Desulfatibacillaceae bacterium]
MGEVKEQGLAVGLLGCGTVGRGVVKLLSQNKGPIKARVGAPLVLARVADTNPAAFEGLELDPSQKTHDALSIVDDPRIPVIVELIGGQGAAKDLMLRALGKGKTVVTANKALLASCGREILEAARKGGGELFFEAAVGGCMPVIKTLRETLAGNRILALYGILNGTCNYILSRITFENLPFEKALQKAQEAGFAEADPFLDISGGDTRHKLALCVNLAFGTPVGLEDIFVEGISHLTPDDIAFAQEFGYRVKLLAIAKRTGNAVQARVHPTMIPMYNMLSNVSGPMNALTLVGDACGEVVLYGQGAGMMPTASAVVSDLADAARNLLCNAHNRIPIMGWQEGDISPLPILPMDEVVTRYYIRLAALDRPGVLSKVAGVLGDNGISISSVHQKGRHIEGPVPIVLLTHDAKESNIQKALKEIAALAVIAAEPVLIRIEEEDEAV